MRPDEDPAAGRVSSAYWGRRAVSIPIGAPSSRHDNAPTPMEPPQRRCCWPWLTEPSFLRTTGSVPVTAVSGVKRRRPSVVMPKDPGCADVGGTPAGGRYRAGRHDPPTVVGLPAP